MTLIIAINGTYNITPSRLMIEHSVAEGEQTQVNKSKANAINTKLLTIIIITAVQTEFP